jgi:penicillin amidase
MKKINRFLKIFGISILIFVVLLASILIVGYIYLRRSLPKLEGKITSPQLSSQVKVFWDNFQVPHIYAKNDKDLYFVLGYLHAQDRLFQIDLNLRSLRGKLAEIFGPDLIETDKFIRTVGFLRAAEESMKLLNNEEIILLESYCAGINKFIEENSNKLPMEFLILGYKPEKWTPVDCVGIGKLISWNQTEEWDKELIKAKLVKKLGDKRAQELFSPYIEDTPVIISGKRNYVAEEKISDFYWLNSLDLEKYSSFNVKSLFKLPFICRLAVSGSNSWALSSNKSETGNVILANDPHMDTMIPSFFYEVHLVSDNTNVIGVTLPGSPVVVIGHNEHIAWGLTNSCADQQDLFIEKINPDNPDQFLYKGEWLDMEIKYENIKVKGENGFYDLPIKIRSTIHGPLISDVVEDIEENISLCWNASHPSNEFRAMYIINKADSFGEFMRGLKNFGTPSMNFTYGDDKGNIGYHLAGNIPIRAGGDGSVPVPGWDGEYDWLDFIPFEHLPKLINPDEGYIVTTNNKIIDDYDFFITDMYEPGWRAKRVDEFLNEKEKFSIDDMKKLQSDEVSLPVRDITTDFLNTMAEGDLETDLEIKAYQILKKWDGNCSKDSIETTIAHIYMNFLSRNILSDNLGEKLFEDYYSDFTSRVEILLLKDDNDFWIDDINTEKIESKKEIMLKSFQEAMAYLFKRYGDNIENWNWGKLHFVNLPHQLGKVKLLALILNSGKKEVGGSFNTVDKAEFDAVKEEFIVTTAPALRQIVDFSDLSNSQFIYAGGQSGNRLSSHYKDQFNLWTENRYRSWFFNDDVLSNVKSTLIFTPED